MPFYAPRTAVWGFCKNMKKFVKFLIAFLLLPTAVFAVAAVGRIFISVFCRWQAALCFLGGAVLYGVIHFACYNFSRPYVFIHEMTHAFAAFLCGYRVKDISVKKESGYVKMSNTNTFVVLAPYFIPGYLVVAAVLYVVAGYFVDLTPYRYAGLAAVGFLLSFHIIQTVKTLGETDQPDLTLAGGRFFSVVMILLANLVVLAVVLKILFPQEIMLGDYCRQIIRASLNAWRIIVNYIVEYVTNLL